jgi:hypothetical protein
MHEEMDKTHRSQKHDDNDWVGIWAETQPERTDSDDEDVGGDEALTKTDDKPKFRMKRSFELLLKSGHVIRFEVCLFWLQNTGEISWAVVLDRPAHVASRSSGLSISELSFIIGRTAMLSMHVRKWISRKAFGHDSRPLCMCINVKTKRHPNLPSTQERASLH